MKNPAVIHELTRAYGWDEFKKQITIQRDGALLQLADPKRPSEMPDDMLRGYIASLNWVLNIEKRAALALAEQVADNAPSPPDAAVGSPMVADTTTE